MRSDGAPSPAIASHSTRSIAQVVSPSDRRGCCATCPRTQDPTRAPPTPENLAAHPPATHPLVRVHPESGRKSLCISPQVMSHIVGMDCEGSLALARSLARHALAERFVYRNRWRPGDLVMWDNRCTMHTATVFDATRYRRLLYRTIIA